MSAPKCFLVYINDLRTTVSLYKYIDDSTLFEICDRKGVADIQESIDIAARLTEHDYIKVNSEKSEEIIISFFTRWQFQKHYPEYKD